jgi:peptidoglycan/xylan/chitin deacetylase (PgdA/CDA1 family)
MNATPRLILPAVLVILAAGCSVIPAQSPRTSRPVRAVAVTIDDLPLVGGPSLANTQDLWTFTTRLLASVEAHKVPAIGFVNESKVDRGNQKDARAAILRMWLDAGFELGNHTYSHHSLYNTPLDQFEADVLRGEAITRKLLVERGMKIRYFRHPFLNTGPDLKTKNRFDRFLASRGYRVAPVTLDNQEWIFADVYRKAKQRGDQDEMRLVADLYVPYMESVFEFYEQLSRDLFGREIPQVLLIHANELNADRFNELATMIELRGYRFITLDEALEDQAYAEPDRYAGKAGISWLQRWAITRGGVMRTEPSLPEYMRKYDYP